LQSSPLPSYNPKRIFPFATRIQQRSRKSTQNESIRSAGGGSCLMTKSRTSIFEDLPEVDVSDFSTKARTDKKAPPKEEVRAVAEAANFPSRQPSGSRVKASSKRPARVYRTGRNIQFSAKVSTETLDAIYSVTEAQQGWVLGYTLERAMAALQRELAAANRPAKRPVD
jgi:hypothetical protein